MTAAAIALTFALGTASMAGATVQPVDEAVVDAQARAIFVELMSPFCPGLTLADCPSPDAFTLRDTIEARLRAGESKDLIFDGLVQQYGTSILADPSSTAIGRVVWGLPIAISILGAVGIALFLRRVKPRPPQAAEPSLDSEDRARLDRELEALD